MQARALGKLKAYMIVFDMDDSINYNDFHNKLTALSCIETWWHYLKSSYLVASRYSAMQLNEEVMKIVPNKRILIVELNIKNRSGALPQVAWDWINTISNKIEPPFNLLM
jgi:hypothetical protein